MHPDWTLRSTPTKMKYRRCSPDENHSVIPYELRLHTVWKSCSVPTKVKYPPCPWVQIKTILWFHNYELRLHTVWKFCPCVQIKTILWFRRNFTLCERHVIPQQKRSTDYTLARESYEQQTVWTRWSTLAEVVYRRALAEDDVHFHPLRRPLLDKKAVDSGEGRAVTSLNESNETT